MQSGIYTFYKLIAGLKSFVICFVVSFLFSSSLLAQDNIEKIIRLNRISDSLTHISAKDALAAAEEALTLSQKIKNDTLTYSSRFSRAVSNYFIGNLNSALEDFIENKKIAEKLNHPIKVIDCLNAIGNVYKDIERNDMALKTYREALAVSYSIKNGSKVCLVESNLALLLNQMKLPDSSIVHCYKILKLLATTTKKDQNFTASIYNALLTNYIDKKNRDSVDKYAEITLTMQKQSGDLLSYSGTLFNLGGFYFKVNNYEKSLEYYQQAFKVNPDNLDLQIEIKKGLGNSLYELKKYKEAALYYWECLGLKDSLGLMQTVDKLSEMEVKYETGKKEEELKRLGAEKEVTDLKAKQSRLWLIASSVGILSVVIVAFVLFRQNKNRQQANKLLQHQNDEIVHQKKEITDSINYAKRIQLAILPPDKMVKQLLPNAFVLYKPKDVVSGDFYWLEEKNGMVMFAAVDCTGHGVPGAMMSVVGLNLLNQAVKEKGLTTPSEILKHLDTGVTDTLRQSADKDSIKDGMDLSLCAYNPKTLELQYAGAFNNLWVVRKNISSSYKPQSKNELFFEEHLLEIKADKFPIGSNLDGVADNYTNYKLQLQKGDCVYLYSDGFADQFGGPKGKKFKYNALKKFLVSVHELPPAEQREKLFSAFESWRGNLEQVDDILVIGVCV
ncbi:MAG: SpoIIE family protein phosphatase [Bacteroidia bacterium]|nr:SpoIIE family protein phosphatase [Bacteroidia bacterium]